LPEIIYESTVTHVGELVESFREQGVLVWFGQDAPSELHEFSILHSVKTQISGPKVGDLLQINTLELPIIAIGDVATENLLNLGHIDLKANGLIKPEMPGDINVASGDLPGVHVGDTLRIISL